jgi:hypothetical protein
MFDLTNAIESLIVEAVPTATPVTPPPAVTPSNTQPAANQVNIDETVDALIKKADIDATKSVLVKNGQGLIDTYLLSHSKVYKGKWDGNVAKRRVDDITAKYLDVGYQIIKLLQTTNPNDINSFKDTTSFLNYLKTIKDNSFLTKIDGILTEFIKPPIESYQCDDPLLKSLVGADDLAEISLETYNNKTIQGALVAMLTTRAGRIKGRINVKNLNSILLNPAAYASGTKAVPDTFDQTLVDNQMYVERIEAIGVAAQQYFLHLANQKQLEDKPPVTPTSVNASVEDFDTLVRNILLEFEVEETTTTEQPEQEVWRTNNPSYQTKVVDPYNKDTWKGLTPLDQATINEYSTFIVNGVSNIIPGVGPKQSLQQKAPPTIYTVGYISEDKSAQAQTLIKALQSIARFKSVKKSLFQRFKQRMSYATQALDALAGMGGAKLYVGS